jgi:hypothetical protein
MPGAVCQTGAELSLNTIAGLTVPVVSSVAPTWIPGLYWVNTGDSNNVYDWNGSAWVKVPAAGSRYLALLTADPDTSGAGGTPAVSLSDLLEDTTSGYARQLFVMSGATPGPPAGMVNANTITFGPYGANMPVADQWSALVTSASGTSGLLLYTWDLDTIEQVSVSQNIVFPAGSLSLGQE